MNNTDTPNFSYSNLNIWRRLYLALLWFGISLLVLGSAMKAFQEPGSITVGVAILIAALTLFAYWTHIAISKRNLFHLKIIAFLNLIPFANIIGLLIMLSIIRVTKNELETQNI